MVDAQRALKNFRITADENGEVLQMARYPCQTVQGLVDDGYAELRSRRDGVDRYGLTRKGLNEANGVVDLNRYRERQRKLRTFAECERADGVVTAVANTFLEEEIGKLVDDGLVRDLGVKHGHHAYALSMKGQIRFDRKEGVMK